ncbi:MAG: hypothetical protein IVW54_10205 [Candidatus Binataceae bacterium]|nr:hypothetical protein [Candidatus Binataceae bacterium]
MSLSKIQSLYAPLLAIMFSVWASQAWAGPVSVTFNGDLLNTLGGACSTSAYNSQCLVGPCICQEFENKKTTGNLIGKNTTEGDGEIDFTIDKGLKVGSSAGDCSPFLASAFISGSKDIEQIDFNGTICSPPNPAAATAKQPIAGGWGMESSSHGHSAFGTVSGAAGFNVVKIILRFKGIGA